VEERRFSTAATPGPLTNRPGMAAYRKDELVAVPVIIRMFVAPPPVFRLFASPQAGEFPMGSMPTFLPGLVGAAFALVPGMTIPMVAVVVSVAGAVLMAVSGLQAHGHNQVAPSRSEPKHQCSLCMYFSWSGTPRFGPA